MKGKMVGPSRMSGREVVSFLFGCVDVCKLHYYTVNSK